MSDFPLTETTEFLSVTDPKSEHQVYHHIKDENTGTPLVSIYIRSLKTTVSFYARFRVQNRDLANGQKYITRSLKTKDFNEAVMKANMYYQDFYFKEKEGRNLIEYTVSDAIDRFLKQYERKVKNKVSNASPHMLRNFKKSIGIFWKEFIGHRSLNSVTVKDFDEYESRRREWARNPTFNNIEERKHGNYKKELANRTIVWEINAFKQFLRWCYGQNIYSGQAFEWQTPKPLLKRERRKAFTDEQLQTLIKYLASDAYLNKGRHAERGSPDKRIVRHRVMLRAYILFMLSTGLRVGEARNLLWGNIDFKLKNSNGDNIVCIEILAEHTKTGEPRDTYGRTGAYKALIEWRNFLNETGEKWNGDTLIFCNDEGKPINHFRESFKTVIEEAGLDTDASGKKTNFTPYTMRHTHITQQVRRPELSTLAIAENCGTSIAMIEQFYSDAKSKDFIDALTG